MERADRIHTLSQALADQIAAGEVVERPASVVKELIENSVDAGATRIDVEIEDAGMTRIRVLDNGRGLHPEDLKLAVRRHATSKIRRVEELAEIHTLGFRGEALASIAAVAHVTIRSRTRGASRGQQLVVRSGSVGEIEQIGMPEGTQIDVASLFASVPARRKFVRAEATEVGHVMDCVVHTALVKPGVSFTLSHGRRRLLSFPATEEAQRVAQVLDRRGRGPYHQFDGERDGIRVYGWLGHPDHAGRQRRGPYVVVRQRVIRDRNLTQIIKTAYGGLLDGRASPVAFVAVDPPTGTVDVNVHPQKSEVRFADNQRVYAATRELLVEAVHAAGWSSVLVAPTPTRELRALDATLTGARAAETASAGARWSSSGRDRTSVEHRGSAARSSAEGAAAGRRYQLQTARATGGGLEKDSDGRQAQVERRIGEAADELRPTVGTQPEIPQLLTVLPGPVALFQHGDEILAVDLRVLRAYLVQSQLLAEFGQGRVQSQQLLRPVVVSRPRQQMDALVRAHAELAGLGIDLEPFGEGALVVRGVPASLGVIESDHEVEVLLDKVVAWAQLRHRGAGQERGAGVRDGAAVVASAAGLPSDATGAAPRLARRWLRELRTRGMEAPFPGVPGISRWTGAQLVAADERSDP
ncbi:MAG: DNA mismatch repair endonuclease MutL [Nannocystaceae bacterium]